MSVQVVSLFRMGIVRPLDERARDQLVTMHVSDSIRCEWLPILGDSHYFMLWQSGLFDAVGVAACGEEFSEYEEYLVSVQKLPQVLQAIAPFRAKGGVAIVVFAESLYGLVDDALRTRMPVMFVL